MAWTYASDFGTARDRLRSLIGDTDSADQLLSDAELAVYAPGGQLAEVNDYLAAAACAEAIAGKFARRVTVSAGGTSAALEGQARAYRDLAAQLRRRGLERGVPPVVSGIDVSAKTVVEADEDRVAPAFTRATGDWP